MDGAFPGRANFHERPEAREYAASTASFRNTCLRGFHGRKELAFFSGQAHKGGHVAGDLSDRTSVAQRRFADPCICYNWF